MTDAATSPAAAPGQRERLRARALPTRTVHLPRNPVAHQAAVEELAAALSALVVVGRGSDRADAEARVLAARAVHDEAGVDVETFTLRCLPPPEWEALVDAHPPTDAQAAKGLSWDSAGFRPAVLAECVVPPVGDAPYTAAEWVQFAADGRVSTGEQDLLVATAVLLNTRAVQLAVGKGSAPTPS